VPWQRAKTLIVRDRRTTPAQHFFVPASNNLLQNKQQRIFTKPCACLKRTCFTRTRLFTPSIHAGARSELSGEVSFHHTNLIPGVNNYSAQRREVPPAATVHNTQISDFPHLYQIDYTPVKQNLYKIPQILGQPKPN
jgi:hypothetical protein